MSVLMSLHVGNKHRQHLHSCRGNSVWAINNQSHDLLYFGSKKKRKIEWNWNSQIGRHAFNLLARICQMHLSGVLDQLSLIFSRLSTLAEAKKRSKTMQFFSMLLVVTNEPTTSITPIIKMIHTNTCTSIIVKPDQLWKHDPLSPLYTDSHLFTILLIHSETKLTCVWENNTLKCDHPHCHLCLQLKVLWVSGPACHRKSYLKNLQKLSKRKRNDLTKQMKHLC